MDRPAPTLTGSSAALEFKGLAEFDLDDAGDRWLDRLRHAERPHVLGKIGSYELLEEISRGAQGVVYRARQPNTRRDIALKRLIAGSMSSPAARARFEREVEIATSLRHPNVVTIHGHEFVDGQPLLVMEFVDGRRVDDWVAASGGPGGQRTVHEILAVFLDVCDAVSHAHQRGVIHRDLKPSNILVDDAGRARLLDFGLAKALGPEFSSQASAEAGATAFVGTPMYAAPEQLTRADEVDTLTDVYALGAVLYQLLTGRTPFDPGSSMAELFDHIRATQPSRPSNIAATDPELDWIVLKAMAKEKAARYQSVHEFATDVRRYLARQPLTAHPPAWSYQARKFLARHRLAATLGGAAIAALIGFAVVTGALAWRLDGRQRDLTTALAREQDARQAADDNAERAVAAMQQAKEQGERHKVVADFLQEMIGSVHSAADGGEAATARQMLDHAARRLDAGELAAQPEIDVQMRLTVARAYYDLGFYQPSSEHTERGLRQSLKVLGHDHETTALFLLQKAQLAERESDLDAADAAYSEALTITERIFGKDSALAGRLWNTIGVMRRTQGRFDESEQALQRALAIQQKLHGPDSGAVGIALRNLAYTQAVQGRYDEALATAQSAVDVLARATGPESIATIFAASYIPRIHALQKKYDEAVAGTREIIARLEQVEGTSNNDVTMMNDRLARLLHSIGRDEEALEAATLALNALRERFPKPHYLVAAELQLCGEAAAALDRHDQAEPFLRESLSIYESLGDVHSDRARSTAQALARSLRAAGRAEEADRIELESSQRPQRR